jgi:hypothetical protein
MHKPGKSSHRGNEFGSGFGMVLRSEVFTGERKALAARDTRMKATEASWKNTSR